MTNMKIVITKYKNNSIVLKIPFELFSQKEITALCWMSLNDSTIQSIPKRVSLGKKQCWNELVHYYNKVKWFALLAKNPSDNESLNDGPTLYLNMENAYYMHYCYYADDWTFIGYYH